MNFIDESKNIVTINEVAPRDGLQMEKEFIPTQKKVDFINSLYGTGLGSIEVTSFVHPKAIPQFVDAEEVMKNIQRDPNIIYNVLVPNLKGAERASLCKADEWGIFLSASDSHNIANNNRSIDDSIKEVEKCIQLGKKEKVRLNGGVVSALGCPFEGRIEFEKLIYITDMYYDLGIRAMNIADSAGMADPKHVFTTMKKLIKRYPDVEFALHLHNTRGMGLANVIAGLQAGVEIFDSAIGGLGGCPYTPGAKGNISTEDLVHMFDLMEIVTNVDLKNILNIGVKLEDEVQQQFESSVFRSGTSQELVKAPITQNKLSK